MKKIFSISNYRPGTVQAYKEYLRLFAYIPVAFLLLPQAARILQFVILTLICWSIYLPLHTRANGETPTLYHDASYAFIQTVQGQDANILENAVEVLPGEQLVFKYQVINTGDVELVWTELFDSLSENLTVSCGLPALINVGGSLSCTTQLIAESSPQGTRNFATATVPIVGTARDVAWYRTRDVGVAIGDFVWADRNGNGVQDVGEPGLAGITVTLLDGLGQAVQETTTDNTGRYLFTELTAGQLYRVEFVLPSMDAAFTLKNRDTPATDSDANPDSGRSDLIILSEGEYNGTIDAGMTGRIASKPSSLGDHVWSDLNGDGIQDFDEPGLANVQVELMDRNSQVIDQQITNANGRYLFTELMAGHYFVRFTPPTGYTFSQSFQTTERDRDSNVIQTITANEGAGDFIRGITNVAELDVGNHLLGWDAGLIPIGETNNVDSYQTFLPLIWSE